MIEASDKINPPHYQQTPLESIEYIEQQLGNNFKYYLLGSVLKYLHRHNYKGDAHTDLKKSQWYLNRLVEMVGKETAIE